MLAATMNAGDWYFPLLITTIIMVDQERPLTSAPRTLRGIRHATADFFIKSQTCKLALVALTLHTTFYCYCGRKTKKVKYVIRASGGGLLLVETTIASIWCLAGDEWKYRYKCYCIRPFVALD